MIRLGRKKVLLNEQVQQVNELSLKTIKEDGHKLKTTLEQLNRSASMQRYGIREQHDSLLNRCQTLQKTVQTLLDELSTSVKEQQTWTASVEKFKRDVQEWMKLCSDCTVQENDATEHSGNWQSLAEQLAKTGEEMQVNFDAMQQKYLRLADSHHSSLDLHEQMHEINRSFCKAKDGAAASLDALQNRIQLAEFVNQFDHLVSAASDWANSIDALLAEIENKMLVEPVAQEEMQLIDDSFPEGDSKFYQAVEAGTALMNKQFCPARVGHQLADLEVQFLQLEQHKQQVKISVYNLQKAEVLKDEINRLDRELMTAEAKLKRCCDRQDAELACRKQQRAELETILSEIQVMKNRFTILCLDSDIACAKHDEYRINSCREWYYELEDTAQKHLEKLSQSIEHHEKFEKKLREMRKKVCDINRKFEQTNAARNLLQSLSYVDLQKQLELLRSYHSDVDSCSSESSLGSLLRNVIDTMIDKRHSEPRRTVEAQYESFKNEIDSLKSSITVAEKTVTEKLILSVQAKKQQFDKEFLHCSNWISGKSESLPRIQSAISDSEDLSLIDQQVKCLADLCCEIDQWQSTVENVKQLGRDLTEQSGQLDARPVSQQNVQELVTSLAIRYDYLKADAAQNLADGKQHFSQKYATACRDFERRRRHICEWIEGTLSKIGDLSYQFEDRRLDAIENSMAEDGERWLNSALKAGTRIPARLQSTSGVEPHPEIQRQLEELMDHWDVLNSAVNQVRANAQAEQPSQQSDTAMSRKFLQCAHVPDRELRKKLQSGLSMHILSIEEIRNPVLDRRFNDVRSQLFDSNCQPKLLFHGTKEENAECIIREGFRFGHRGKFGVGIYFATNLASSARHSEDAIKCLLVCEVLVGLKWTCNDINDEIDLSMVQGRGFDSVYSRLEFLNTAGGGADDEDKDEYVIYRTEQATPRYLVKLLLDT
ncbi:hypothetical protein BOX15_Mlig001219g2 [Macrostomum lignano]|uniref:Poly [ADP-ribose] polymerase n=1 Tax=Macrostomum lignano TaxID=282301 RepID=A0A267F385_9PLAT|nr:hypothetical protein BOX15_Mlig001219g2 [Macrostomum lignano]